MGAILGASEAAARARRVRVGSDYAAPIAVAMRRLAVLENGVFVAWAAIRAAQCIRCSDPIDAARVCAYVAATVCATVCAVAAAAEVSGGAEQPIAFVCGNAFALMVAYFHAPDLGKDIYHETRMGDAGDQGIAEIESDEVHSPEGF
jgi:hypothetical protein